MKRPKQLTYFEWSKWPEYSLWEFQKASYEYIDYLEKENADLTDALKKAYNQLEYGETP